MATTLSKSSILFIGSNVIKSGGDAKQQCERLRQMNTVAVVSAKPFFGNSYTMPKLAPVLPMQYSFSAAILALRLIWAKTEPNQSVSMKWQTALQNLLEHKQSVLIRHWYQNIFTRVSRSVRYGCMTHGDATMENTMQDPAIGYIFIDPLVPRPYMPPHPIVDYAKLAQSALGWEYMRRGWRLNMRTQSRIAYVASLLDKEDIWWWTALALQRILWRDPDDKTKAFCEDRIERLLRWRDIRLTMLDIYEEKSHAS